MTRRDNPSTSHLAVPVDASSADKVLWLEHLQFKSCILCHLGEMCISSI
jgi:hypothetical protein